MHYLTDNDLQNRDKQIHAFQYKNIGLQSRNFTKGNQKEEYEKTINYLRES